MDSKKYFKFSSIKIDQNIKYLKVSFINAGQKIKLN